MTAVEYLRERLSILAMRFPSVVIKYGFDISINTHVVELSPQHEYYSNSELDNEWIPISLDFMEKFPNDYISFVSEDSILKIDEPEFYFNEKHVEVINLDNIFNEILNSNINIDFAKHFETYTQHSTFIVHNETEFKLVSIPNSNNIIGEINSNLYTNEQLSSYQNDELPQAA